MDTARWRSTSCCSRAGQVTGGVTFGPTRLRVPSQRPSTTSTSTRTHRASSTRRTRGQWPSRTSVPRWEVQVPVCCGGQPRKELVPQGHLQPAPKSKPRRSRTRSSRSSSKCSSSSSIATAGSRAAGNTAAAPAAAAGADGPATTATTTTTGTGTGTRYVCHCARFRHCCARSICCSTRDLSVCARYGPTVCPVFT